ncbi:MAG: pilus assembly protein TadC [Lachnospiraceae bacterium]|nr:pilus assembly protein TadC [Lachnospiraceae bacterium]
MLTTQDIVIFAIGGVFLLIWLFFFFYGKKYAALFDTLEESEYPLKELFFWGYGVMEFFHYTYKGKSDRKLRQSAEILYEKKYAEFYIRLSYAQKLTYASLLFLIGFVLYGLTSEVVILVVMAVFSFTAYYYYGTLMLEQLTKRQEELLKDFSEVISKLALLTNAGMILREAWEKVAFNGNTPLYQEMQYSVELMSNGVSEVEALQTFGSRCVLAEIKKAVSTMVQGLIKGNKELVDMLQAQSAESWQLKKHLATREGEKAASKLLMPMMLMFVGILIMVLIPIFANLGM